jgi:chitinase
VQWGIYAARNYHIKNIVTSNSHTKLTHINYSFGNVNNGQCIVSDMFADYDKAYDAAGSVNGVADCWDPGCLRGSFGQIKKMKTMPAAAHIKAIYSFGGWTWSGGFGQAAGNATAFANQCYDIVNGVGTPAAWAGTFDGIDIDWEYPNACGLSCDTSGFGSYKTLMSALRSRFGSQLVTSAITADGSSGGKMDAADYGGAAASVDWYNLMTYDYFGAWAASGPTAPHSPLTSYTGIPAAGFNSDAAVQKLKGKGVSGSKILLGIGFYGRGWTGVSGGGTGSLGGTATGPAPCTGFSGCEVGIDDYKVLAPRAGTSYTVAGTHYKYDGSQWWSYDRPSEVTGKKSYKNTQGLGGLFFWELSGDTASGALIAAF